MAEETEMSAESVGFGEMLRRAREEQQLSIGEMVVRTRLSVPQLRAIEAEDMAQLPEGVYVRAFIRGYARSLGLDAQMLVDDYNARYGAKDQPETHQIPRHDLDKEEVFSTSNKHRGYELLFFALVVLAVAAGIWSVYTEQWGKISSSDTAMVEKVPLPNKNVVPATPDLQASTSAQAERAATEGVATQTPPEESPAPIMPETKTVVSPVTEGVAVSDAVGVNNASSAPQAEESSPAAPLATEVSLTLKSSGSCWVQAVTPEGRNIIAREMKENNTLAINVPRGTRITFGNVDVMSLLVDGRPLDLKSSSRGGVARFVVK